MHAILIAALTLVMLLGVCSVAEAHHIRAAKYVALTYWHKAPCEGKVKVGRMEDEKRWVGYASYRLDVEGRQTDCRIFFNTRFRRYWKRWQDFCSIFLHEWGHLVSFRAKNPYVRPDGTKDYAHSANPNHIMYPIYQGKPHKYCRKRPQGIGH